MKIFERNFLSSIKMDLTQLENLPPEIRYQILEILPFESLVNACQVSLLDFCDWNFWRRKAFIDFEIPYDYFDLALSRNITGTYRYLEISSRFRPSLESLASIENGTVFGIYEFRALFLRASLDNQIDLVKKLLPYAPEKLIKEALELSAGAFPPTYIPAEHNSISGNIKVFILLYNVLRPPIKSLAELYPASIVLPYEYLENKEWDLLENYMKENRGTSSFYATLIYSQENRAFSLVQKYIDKMPNHVKVICLRSALQCGNEEQFEWLYSKTQELPPKTNSGDYIWKPFYKRVSSYAEYNLILDAYVGANLTLIKRLEEIGYTSENEDSDLIIAVVISGYKKRLSNPVSVYRLIESRLKNQWGDLGLDIDISNMIFQDLEEINKNRGGEYIDTYDISSNISILLGKKFTDEYFELNEAGNVDLLNFLLGKYLELGGSKRDLVRIFLKKYPGFPLCRQLLEAYVQ